MKPRYYHTGLATDQACEKCYGIGKMQATCTRCMGWVGGRDCPMCGNGGIIEIDCNCKEGNYANVDD